MPTLPVYIKSLGATDSIIGLISGIFTVSALITRPVSGVLLDRLGRKGIFLVGIIIFTVSALSYSWFSIVWVIMVFRFIHGFGWGGASTAASIIASDNIPKQRFGEGMGYFSLSSSLAMAIGPAIGLYIVSKYNFNNLAYIAAILAVLGLLLSLTLKYKKVNKQEVSKERSSLFEKAAIRPSIVIFFLALANSTIISFLSLYATQKGILNIGLFFTVNAIAMLISRPIFGKIIDRVGFDFVVMPGLICVLIAIILISQASSINILLIASFIHGVGFGASQSSLQTMSVVNTATNRLGAANATFLTGYDSGIGLGSIIFGIVSSVVGYSQMYHWATVPVIIAFILYLLLARKKVTKCMNQQIRN